MGIDNQQGFEKFFTENLNSPNEELLDKVLEFEKNNGNIQNVMFTRTAIMEDLKKTNVFHWIIEFSEIFSESTGFDVVIGNPPYGNLVSPIEEVFIADSYETREYNEIAAHFIERQIKSLLREDGYFGNITTNSMLADSTMHALHNVVRENLTDIYASAFAKRPSKVFRNAEINVAITIGKKSQSGNCSWKTSDFIRFNEEEP
ncbi:MAG: Eco57I restriction-modification methylase domain-containing protein [Promethearchaeia archaeon]